MTHIRLLLFVAAVAANLVVPAAAKGIFNIVAIAGPDWHSEIEITDPEVLASLEMGVFLIHDREVSPPAKLDRGYLITRGYEDGPERHMFDRIVYFPGSPSYAYYLEIVNGAGPMDGNWYAVSEQGNRALAAALQKHGVSLPEPSTVTLGEPIEQTASETVPPVIESPRVSFGVPETVGVLTVAVLLGGAAGWVLRTSRDRSKPAPVP